LPEGLKITKATIQESVNGECQQVILTVFNSSRRDVKLTAETVLAELSANSELLEALVGPACETAIRIEGIETPCLLDSGSQVTVVSEAFYRQHLQKIPLQKVNTDLHVIGAGGQDVPFLGMLTELYVTC
jgi:hypothetical protein